MKMYIDPQEFLAVLDRYCLNPDSHKVDMSWRTLMATTRPMTLEDVNHETIV